MSNTNKTNTEVATVQDGNVSLTVLESSVLIECLNYDNIASQLSDNHSNCDLSDAHKICGGKHQASGVIGSLCKKGLIYDPLEQENKIIYLTEDGVRAIFAHIANNS
jgi:hypothetical protein